MVELVWWWFRIGLGLASSAFKDGRDCFVRWFEKGGLRFGSGFA